MTHGVSDTLSDYFILRTSRFIVSEISQCTFWFWWSIIKLYVRWRLPSIHALIWPLGCLMNFCVRTTKLLKLTESNHEAWHQVLKISSCLISPEKVKTEILNSCGGILSFLITGSEGKVSSLMLKWISVMLKAEKTGGSMGWQCCLLTLFISKDKIIQF